MHLQELAKNVRRIVKIVNTAIIYQVLQLQYIQHSICKPLNRSVSILTNSKFFLLLRYYLYQKLHTLFPQKHVRGFPKYYKNNVSLLSQQGTNPQIPLSEYLYI